MLILIGFLQLLYWFIWVIFWVPNKLACIFDIFVIKSVERVLSLWLSQSHSKFDLFTMGVLTIVILLLTIPIDLYIWVNNFIVMKMEHINILAETLYDCEQELK